MKARYCEYAFTNSCADSSVPLTEHLKSEGLLPERVAVMVNGEILPKSEYAERVLTDGDSVEIVGFVGGG